MLGAALGLRSREWAYTLGSRNITSQVRKAREVTVTMRLVNVRDGMFDRFMRATDAEVRLSSPGTLRVHSLDPNTNNPSDFWEQHAYLVKTESQSHFLGPDASIDLTFVLVDGVWSQPKLKWYGRLGADPDAPLDYPYDFPFDYGPMNQAASITNPELTPTPFKWQINGPVTNPIMEIAGNRYEVNGVTVPDGGILEVDGVSEPKSILLRGPTGTITDVFDKGVRGSGLDSGTYIFQPIPPGTFTVGWAGNFNFFLEMWFERSEPPWIS